MAPQLVLAALALACLGVASQPDCNELVKPLADLGTSLGKWIFYAGTTDTEESLAKLKTFSSSWINPKRYPTDAPETLEFADRVDGKCIHFDANLTAVGDRLHLAYTFENHTFLMDGHHLETCPDCLLWTDTTTSPGLPDSKHLFIFTRSGNLSLPDLKMFKQQAACLNFTLGLHMGSTTDLCPEEKEEKPVKEDE